MRLDLHELFLARQRLAQAGMVVHTPLVYAEGLSRRWQCQVWLKLDQLQPTGSFKLRGACHALLSLPAEQQRYGVAAASTGNFGRALGYAGQRLGIPVRVFISERVPANKVAALQASGAEVIISGPSQDAAEALAQAHCARSGMVYLSPFDDPAVILGQGTCGLEILQERPETDTLIVGLSGGGLLGGVALAAKSIQPDIQVIGASLTEGAAMLDSLAAGQPVAVPEVDSLADSLGGGIGLHNRWTFALVRRWMDQGLRVSEASIARAMVYLLEEEKLLVEGACAATVGAVEQHALDLRGRCVVLVLSGRNVDLATLDRARRLIQTAGGDDADSSTSSA